MRINVTDEKDRMIIRLLIKDGRMSYSDIAAEIGLTRTAVKNRVKRLEDCGIIKGYRAIVNPIESDEMMTFVVNVETTPESFDAVREYFVDSDKTATVVQTTGKCHIMAICISGDVAGMRDFINTVYKELPGVLSVSAHGVLDVMKGSVISEK